MTFGDKLSKLRKESNYTQEQLAGILGVSRQAVSKWESGLAFPETEKLIRISELFGCSLDYLLKDNSPVESDAGSTDSSPEEDRPLFTVRVRGLSEKKSSVTLFGLPLYHIGKKARGIFAIGIDAKGIFSVGLVSRGILSFGLLSLGVISFGSLSAGILALGALALGLFSAGGISVGILSAGAISIGVFALGGVAIGDFSTGALAIGKYAAMGDSARAMIALGDSEADGSLYRMLGDLSSHSRETVIELLNDIVPSYLNWAKKLFIALL